MYVSGDMLRAAQRRCGHPECWAIATYYIIVQWNNNTDNVVMLTCSDDKSWALETIRAHYRSQHTPAVLGVYAYPTLAQGSHLDAEARVWVIDGLTPGSWGTGGHDA